VECANCGRGILLDCEDQAVRCIGGDHDGVESGLICLECQETARKREIHPLELCGNRTRTEFLCAGCCAKQDAAANKLEASINEITPLPLRPPKFWLDDILEKLEAATEKAREAL
jgi:hypothetical protein